MQDVLRQDRYGIRKAARLVGLHPNRVRQWLTPIGQDRSSRLVSFLDLVELYMVRELLKDGFRFSALRKALQEAAKRLGVDHPLAHRRFLVDGAPLFDLPETIPGIDGQFVLARILQDRAKTLEFDPAGLACRWWPLGRNSMIVVDPDTLWGEPRIDGTRLSTHVLASAVRAEGNNFERVAESYEIPVANVHLAVEFEGLQAA